MLRSGISLIDMAATHNHIEAVRSEPPHRVPVRIQNGSSFCGDRTTERLDP